jgi:hypothetical protein
MRAAARARAFEGGGEIEATARLEKGRDIVAPRGFVEIDGQKVAGLIQQKWIDASNKGLPIRIASGEMPANDRRTLLTQSIGTARYASQFSTLSAGTRLNSETLAVTQMAPIERA